MKITARTVMQINRMIDMMITTVENGLMRAEADSLGPSSRMHLGLSPI